MERQQSTQLRYQQLAQPSTVRATRAARSIPAMVLPPVETQAHRLAEPFARLRGLYAQLRALKLSAPGSVVLVCETAGEVPEIRQLATREDEMEWLGEWPQALAPNEAFYLADAPEDELPGNHYQLLFTAPGLYALLGRWQRYCNGRPARGDKKWFALFERLYALRPWTAHDRVHETGFWQRYEEAENRSEPALYFEIELWYRPSQVHRRLAAQEVRRLLQRWGGEAVGPGWEHRGIGYQGILARIATPELRKLRAAPATGLLLSPFVKYLRPTDHLRVQSPKDEPLPLPEDLPTAPPLAPDAPRPVALLDGRAMVSHPLLAGRVRMQPLTDAPPPEAAISDRRHATAIASLILYGDLNQGRRPLPIELPLYPLLQPGADHWASEEITEHSPGHRLPLQLMADTLDQLLAHPDDVPPQRQPRVVVLAFNDLQTRFADRISPLARLLDYYSARHGLLFLTATGNFDEAFLLNLRPEELYALQGAPMALQRATLQHLYEQAAARRLQSPGEALNALTIGGAHQDAAPLELPDQRYDLLEQAALGSPYSRQGPGYRNSLKPEVLFPGGRQLYTDQFFMARENARLAATSAVYGKNRPPGLAAAAPTATGEPGLSYSCGADKAVGLAAHLAARLRLQLPPIGNAAQEAALLKALLVHAANKQRPAERVEHQLADYLEEGALPAWLDAYLGLGVVLPDAPLFRGKAALQLYTGALQPGAAHRFSLPVPMRTPTPALVATLAWFSPIEPRGGPYRRVRLWGELPGRSGFRPRLNRLRPQRLGTLWHEHFHLRDDRNTAPEELHLQVNCKLAHRTAPLRTAVAYALVLHWAE